MNILSIDEITKAINSIGTARRNMLESVTHWNTRQASFKPDPDVWSANEILEHSYLVEHLLLQQMWNMKHEFIVRSAFPAEHSNRNRCFEDIVRPFIANKYKSPSFTAPKGGTTSTFWIEAIRANQFITDKLPLLLDGADAEMIVFPHFVLGPLDAMQWIAFLPFHMDRHRQQIERLRHCDNFPA